MNKIVLVAVALFLVVYAQDDQGLTFPMNHMRLSYNQSSLYHKQSGHHHLRHFTAEEGTETYPLHSLKTIFTISLNVNGFDYNLSIDTGSSDLFIKGQKIEGSPQRKFSCPQCLQKNQYVQIGYLDGKLDTYVHNSSIKLGRHSFNETILVAYASDNIGNFKKIGGILGLSFQQISRNPYPNFMNTLIKQNIIKKYRFGLKLNFKDPETSFITFGGMDHQYIDPAHQLAYYDILGQTFSYKLSLKHLKFGSKQLDIKVSLIDSGNTCVSIPDSHTDDMLQQLNQGGNECEFQVQSGNNLFKLLVCKVVNFDLLPVISVTMPDEKVYTWEKQYYIDKCFLLSQEDETPKYKCDTFIQNVKYRDQSLFLGAGWMLKYYAVFDLDSRKIGMAKNRDNPTLDSIISKAKQNTNGLLRKMNIKNQTNLQSQVNKVRTSDQYEEFQ